MNKTTATGFTIGILALAITAGCSKEYQAERALLEKCSDPSPDGLVSTAQRNSLTLAEDRAGIADIALKIEHLKGCIGKGGNPLQESSIKVGLSMLESSLNLSKSHVPNVEANELHRLRGEVTKLAKEARDKETPAERAAKRKTGVRVGMSEQDVRDSSWGKPRSINRTSTAHGDSEQWVYNGNYLYFTNGVLTAIQN